MLAVIKKYFFDRFVKNHLSFSAIVRRPANFEQARTIGILVDATSETHRAAAVQYAEQLRKNGKQIDLRGYVNTADLVDNYPFKTWNKKNLSWSGQLQWGSAASGETVYRPLPDWEGTSQTPPFRVIFAVAAIISPRSCLGSITQPPFGIYRW